MEKRTTGVLSLMALLILMFGTSFAKAGERGQPDHLTKKELKSLAAAHSDEADQSFRSDADHPRSEATQNSLSVEQ